MKQINKLWLTKALSIDFSHFKLIIHKTNRFDLFYIFFMCFYSDNANISLKNKRV